MCQNYYKYLLRTIDNEEKRSLCLINCMQCSRWENDDYTLAGSLMQSLQFLVRAWFFLMDSRNGTRGCNSVLHRFVQYFKVWYFRVIEPQSLSTKRFMGSFDKTEKSTFMASSPVRRKLLQEKKWKFNLWYGSFAILTKLIC